MFKVAVVVGSLRPTSHNHKLARALARLAAGRLQFEFVEIGDLPFYDDTVWPNPPASITRLREQILGADAVLFVTPEYNRSIPGILKNAIDWGSRPWGQSAWKGKPGAIVGATPGAIGTAVAQAHLRSIATVLDMAIMGQPEVYFTSRPGLIDDNDDVTDETTRAFLSGWVARFETWITRFADTDVAIAAE